MQLKTDADMNVEVQTNQFVNVPVLVETFTRGLNLLKFCLKTVSAPHSKELQTSEVFL